MEQVLKSKLKHFNQGESLGFAYFWLLLFLVVEFARPEDWIPGLEAAHLARMTVVLILLALAFSFNNISWRMPREAIFFILLVAQLWLTVPFSPVWRMGAFNVMLGFSKVVPLVIVIYGVVRSIKRLRWILFAQAACVAAVAIVSIANRHTSGRLQGALSGMYQNPNDFALIIDLTLPLCLALALTTRSYWKKLAWTIAMLAMIYALFLTASRGGLIALVVAALVCLWQFGIKSRRFYLILLVPVAVLVISLYGGNAVRNRFEQTNLDTATQQRSTEASSSALERKELLIRSLRVTAEHPLLGVGPGNFEIISGMWRVTHNSYTQVSAEGGIPAFLFYVLIFWCAIVNLRKVRKYSNKRVRLFSLALEASLVAYLVGSFFASVAYYAFPYCLAAYTGVLRIIVQRHKRASRLASQSSPTPIPVEVTAWQ